jgi:bacterioferritin-associated ferredoxin
MLDFDSDICVCFHVSLRKLWHFTRRERPQVTAQMTECLGAGTGCQSCVPLLAEIRKLAPEGDQDALIDLLNTLEAKRDARRHNQLGDNSTNT